MLARHCQEKYFLQKNSQANMKRFAVSWPKWNTKHRYELVEKSLEHFIFGTFGIFCEL